MKLKASEFLALQIDKLEDVSKFLKQNIGKLNLSAWNDLAIEILREIEEIEKNLTDFYVVMISKEQEKIKRSEL